MKLNIVSISRSFCLGRLVTTAVLIAIAGVSPSQGPISVVWERNHGGPVYAVAYSPDGKYVASGGEPSYIKIWNASNGALAQVIYGHTWAINSLQFTDDGEYLVSGSRDGTVRMWQVPSGAPQALMNHGAVVLGVSVKPFEGTSHTIVSVADNGTAKMWTTPEQTSVFSLALGGVLNGTSFGSGGTIFTVGSWSGVTSIFNAGNGAYVNSFLPGVGPVSCSQLNTHGTILCSSGYSGIVTAWKSQDNWLSQNFAWTKTVPYLGDGPVSTRFIEWPGMEGVLVCGGRSNILRCLRSSNGNELWQKTLPYEINSMDVSPDLSRAVVGSFLASSVTICRLPFASPPTPRESKTPYVDDVACSTPRTDFPGNWTLPLVARGQGSPRIRVRIQVDSDAPHEAWVDCSSQLRHNSWSPVGDADIGSIAPGKHFISVERLEPGSGHIASIHLNLSPFDPSVNGFHFENWPLIGDWLGLCTGMCVTAEEYRSFGFSVPPITTPPPATDALYSAIALNHASGNIAFLPAFLRCDSYSNAEENFFQEFSYISTWNQMGLEGCLLLRKSGQLFDNHCVLGLATLTIDRMALDPTEYLGIGKLIWVYDPNRPNFRRSWVSQISYSSFNVQYNLADYSLYDRISSAEFP